MHKLMAAAFGLCCLVQAASFGQQPAGGSPSPTSAGGFTLSEGEARQVSAALQLIQARDNDLRQAINDVLQVPLEASKTLEVVAKAQATLAKLQTAQAEFKALRGDFRARYGCAECDFSPDYKALVKIQAAKP
jgi:hypothetical protein